MIANFTVTGTSTLLSLKKRDSGGTFHEKLGLGLQIARYETCRSFGQIAGPQPPVPKVLSFDVYWI